MSTAERAPGRGGRDSGREDGERDRDRHVERERKKETGTRGTKKGRRNKRTGKGSENRSVTGIVMEDEIVGIGITGMRGTGRNVLPLESLLGSPKF